MKMNIMNKKTISGLSNLIVGVLLAASPAVAAENASGNFTTEPDKTLAAAHESFVKGDMDKAAAQIHKAADYVKKQSDNVAADSKAGFKTAGEGLDKLGDDVKKGTVKSEAALKKSFAKADHEIAGCWHKTAIESKKAGKDSVADLKKAGASLAGAAKWSDTKLKEGTHDSIEGVKKAGRATGEGVKAGADEVDKWFKGIGDGIADLGRKL
jgi:hypothetical protein